LVYPPLAGVVAHAGVAVFGRRRAAEGVGKFL